MKKNLFLRIIAMLLVVIMMGTMVVACENPIIAQELLLHKIMLIKKFEPYAKSLNMRVVDLKFDAKKWEL